MRDAMKIILYSVFIVAMLFLVSGNLYSARVVEEEEDVFRDIEEKTIKDPARWDTLSKDVIPRIIRHTEDLGTSMRRVKKAQCTINAKITSRLTGMTTGGKLTFVWDDENGDGILTAGEINVDIEDTDDMTASTAINAFRTDLKFSMLCNVYNLFQIHHVKTQKTGAGYLMTLKPVNDATEGKWVPHRTLELKVSEDFRILEISARGEGDSRVIGQYKHKKLGGRWVVVGYVYNINLPNGVGKAVQDTAYTFKIRNGMAFLENVVIEESISISGTVVGTFHQYDCTDWKIKSRDKALGMPKPSN